MAIWHCLGHSVVLGLVLVSTPAAEAKLHPQPWSFGQPILVSDDTAAGEMTRPSIGPVTGLPLPRFASLRSEEGNVRHGPSLEEPVKWVFVREAMPLRVIDEAGAWRRVEDRDGEGGWIHFFLLSGTRTVSITEERLALRSRAQDDAPEIALLEGDVIARIKTCTVAWCEIGVGDYIGWAPKSALWGVGADEVIE